MMLPPPRIFNREKGASIERRVSMSGCWAGAFFGTWTQSTVHLIYENRYATIFTNEADIRLSVKKLQIDK